MSDYGWIITKDHLFDPTIDSPEDDETGKMGPSDIPENLETLLNLGHGYVFYIYDDDRELYYSGRLVFNGDEPDEDMLAGPLDDFGRPNAGAIMIEYKGHPEWNIG